MEPAFDDGFDTQEHVNDATEELVEWLEDRKFDIVTMNKCDEDAVLDLAENLSQLTSLISVQIEANAIKHLNQELSEDLPEDVRWARNDRIHGEKYPDLALADMSIQGEEDVSDRVWPGIEIKAWCPFATEITGRLKKGQSVLKHAPSTVVLVCWMPENLIYGKPKIFDIWVGDAMEMAKSRDNYWNEPPKDIIVEPDYSPDREAHKQHTNVTRYRLMNSEDESEAKEKAKELGILGEPHSYESDYQEKLDELRRAFSYKKGSNNFRKLQRLHHPSLQEFIEKAPQRNAVMGKTFAEWKKHMKRGDEEEFKRIIRGTGQKTITSS